MRIYLDGVFLMNFMVDFLLILGTNRLTGFPPSVRRAAAAGLLGGLYGMLCLLPDLRFLGGIHWRIVFFGLVSMVAFGFDRTAWSRGAILLLLSMALGGIASGAGANDFAAVCLCALLVAALCSIGFGGQGIGRSFIPVELNWQGRSVRVLALRDTGNTLRDPLTGEQVLVCGADVGAELLGIPEERFSDPLTLMSSGSVRGLRLIPYHSVGQRGGMIIGLRLKNVKIGDGNRDALVAFAPQRIGNGEGYRMLTGGMM